MSVTLTYDGVLSRVRISVTGLVSGLHAHIERSTNQVTWTTVRGGASVPIAGGVCSLDDYEFAPNVVNYYRVSSFAVPAFVAAGAAVHADNAPLDPPLPAGAASGHLLLIWAAVRNVAGVVDTPGGYALLGSAGNARLFGKIHSGSESAPHVTFLSAAGQTTSAQMAAFSGASLAVHAGNLQANASAQDISYPALGITHEGCLVLFCAQKHDDWTSVATLPGGTEIGDPSSTLGNDQGIVWDFKVQTVPTNVAAGSFTVTGGAAEISVSVVMALLPNATQQTNNITPNLTSIWIKNLTRPFLNRAVTVVGWSDVTEPARQGLFDVVGRDYPVSVSDKRGSRRYDLTVMQPDPTTAEDFRLCLKTGDPVLVHVPPDCDVPGMYAAVGDTTTRRSSARGQRRFFTLPLTEVAAPTSELVPATLTYQTVLNSYATYTALLAAEATYADVLEGIGSPGDVIVP